MIEFSVLMSVYKNDNPVYLKKSLESIWDNQILKPNEILLIIDGEVSSSIINVINEFKKRCPIFDFFELNKNVGLANCLKIGLEKVRYEIVARMDADDIASNERFETQINFLIKNESCVLVGSSINEFNQNPGDLNSIRKIAIKFDEIKKIISYRNPINHPTVMFRKKYIIDVGSYVNVRNFEDYYLWLRLINAGYLIENINLPLLNYRIGNGFIKRRYGLNYLKDEIYFLKLIKKEKLINAKSFYISIIIRIISRSLPQKILKYIYLNLFRKKL
jgi:hypothetical protein